MFLIYLHVFTMSLSLGLLLGAILVALRQIKWSMFLANSSIVTGGIGFASGFILLFTSPVLSKCVLLLTYLLVMIVVYGYGFGWGKQSKAKLFRSIS